MKMRPTFKKLEVKDIGDLERLVAENIEGIETGLKVVDSRLLLGQAAIDLVGLDTKGSLVLIALDFIADEGLLLRVMDAYSWCLEYPDALRRLYPMAQISQNRPPRILFIVERLTDSFVRRIKQLSFLEIDCLEFRHLEVNGASALYFDLVQRLRRADATTAEIELRGQQAPPTPGPEVPGIALSTAPAIAGVPLIEPMAPVIAEPVPATGVVLEPFAPAEIQLGTATALSVGPADSLDVRAAEPLLDGTTSSVQKAKAEALALIAEHAVVVPVESETALESVTTAAPEVQPVAPLVDPASNPEWQALLEDLGVQMPKPVSTPFAEPEPTPVAHEEAEAAMGSQATETPVGAIEPVPSPIQQPAWAKPSAQPIAAPNRAYFFAQAVKGNAPAEAPTAPTPSAAAPEVSPAPASAEAIKPAEEPAEARPELEALNFPKDGLSRQWLEFLNQLSATK
jgi:hypothetical protein